MCRMGVSKKGRPSHSSESSQHKNDNLGTNSPANNAVTENIIVEVME